MQKKKENFKNGLATSEPANGESTIVEFDMEKVAAIWAECERFQASFRPKKDGLAQIVKDGTLIKLLGLDPMHAALLQAALKKPVWSRSEFDQASAERHLLPEGAIDTINEAAFDHFNCPIFEGDDPLEVDPDFILEK